MYIGGFLSPSSPRRNPRQRGQTWPITERALRTSSSTCARCDHANALLCPRVAQRVKTPLKPQPNFQTCWTKRVYLVEQSEVGPFGDEAVRRALALWQPLPSVGPNTSVPANPLRESLLRGFLSSGVDGFMVGKRSPTLQLCKLIWCCSAG